MSPPAISTVFPIYIILYSISIASILIIKKPHFDKTYQNTHSTSPLQSLTTSYEVKPNGDIYIYAIVP